MSPTKLHLDGYCPCGSGRKFRHCCSSKLGILIEGRTSPMHVDRLAELGPLAEEVREATKPGIVVKVQWPLAGAPSCLVYDRERTFRLYVTVTEELRVQMKGETKAFFYATVLQGQVKLLEPAPWQEW